MRKRHGKERWTDLLIERNEFLVLTQRYCRNSSSVSLWRDNYTTVATMKLRTQVKHKNELWDRFEACGAKKMLFSKFRKIILVQFFRYYFVEIIQISSCINNIHYKLQEYERSGYIINPKRVGVQAFLWVKTTVTQNHVLDY